MICAKHEAWNHGDTPRVVLIVDVPRPGLPAILRALDRVLMGIISNSPKLQEFLDKSEVDVADRDDLTPESDDGFARAARLA